MTDPTTTVPSPADARGSRGFVLIVVLMLLASLSLLVSMQVRQSGAGQTITVNSADYLLAEAAAQSVLSYCEASVMHSAGLVDSVRVTTPGTRGTDEAAWRTAAKWLAASVGLGGDGAVTFPGVQAYDCLFEDATADLVPSQNANDIDPESGAPAGVCNTQPGMPPQLCKYRITARVTLNRGRQIFLQSELRFAI